MALLVVGLGWYRFVVYVDGVCDFGQVRRVMIVQVMWLIMVLILVMVLLVLCSRFYGICRLMVVCHICLKMVIWFLV